MGPGERWLFALFFCFWPSTWRRSTFGHTIDRNFNTNPAYIRMYLVRIYTPPLHMNIRSTYGVGSLSARGRVQEAGGCFQFLLTNAIVLGCRTQHHRRASLHRRHTRYKRTININMTQHQSKWRWHNLFSERVWIDCYPAFRRSRAPSHMGGRWVPVACGYLKTYL